MSGGWAAPYSNLVVDMIESLILNTGLGGTVESSLIPRAWKVLSRVYVCFKNCHTESPHEWSI